MKPKRPQLSFIIAASVALALTSSAPSARANVYATNIKINGVAANASVRPGASIDISYILNEPASAGITIRILAGGTVVRAISVASGPGTTRGLNTVAWDGKDNSSQNVPPGNYSVSVTAAATGYPDWTQISNDSDPGNYAYQPTGLAVSKNTNSPFYGRIFVGNSVSGGVNTGKLGDQVGILMLNADGSFADEGGFSTGGYAWAGDGFSPWKMEVSADDKLYVNDWTGNGIILAFDQLLSNPYLSVLRNDNNPGGLANMSGPAITGIGTATQIWMADINTANAGGTGITRWNVTANFTCAANDPGTQIVPLSSDLDIYPYDVFVDKNNYIYAIQFVTANGNPSARVLRFPPFTGVPLTTANWKAGANDDTMRGAIGLAVDPTATFVAVSFSVFFPTPGGGVPRSGGIAILRASDGSLVSRTVAPLHDTPVVAWDNVGNVYTCDNGDSFWRAYSPPGANQATTIGLEIVTVLQPPHITSIAVSGGTVTINFTGASGDPASAFTLLGTPVVNGPYTSEFVANITRISAGVFQATLPTNGSKRFFQVRR